MKRNFESNRIDLKYLLLQPTLTAEWEYQCLGQLHPYQKYLTTFYSRKLRDIFDKEKENSWFVDRYVDINSGMNACSHMMPALIIEDVDDKLGYAELEGMLREMPGFRGLNIVQKNYEDGFSRDVEVVLDDGSVDEAFEFTSQLGFTVKKVCEFEVAERRTIEYASNDYRNIKKIAKMFFYGDFYNQQMLRRNENEESVNTIINNHEKEGNKNNNENKDLGDTENKEMADIKSTTLSDDDLKARELVDAVPAGNPEKEKADFLFLNDYLREKHLFCFYCVRKFDTVFDMRRRCGSAHLFGSENRVLFTRKMNLLLQRKDVDIKPVDDSEELDKVVFRLRDVFACDVCKKAFQTSDFVKKHFRNKHPEQYQEILSSTKLYERVLRNFDFLIFSYVEGLTLNYIPFYLDSLQQNSDRIKYDFKKWFSGDVKIKR